MATNKAHKKRHKRELKAKEKRKRLRTQIEQRFVLKYGEYLNQFSELIFANFKPLNMSAYRWVHNPLIKDDSLPQLFQSNDSRNVDDLESPPLESPKELILEYVSNFTLSNYDTQEHAEEVYLKWIEKFSKRKDASIRIQNWIRKIGLHIVKVDYTSDKALIGPIEGNGHVEALLADGVDMESLLDTNFEPYKIDIKYDEA